MSKVGAVIVAAGSSTRMGDVDKTFAPILGLPLVIHTIDQFESHLNEFSSSAYNVKSIDFIIDNIINDIDLPKNTIAITVDDADNSFYDVAWPRFKELGFPVTLFISTKSIGPGNKNYVSWDQIRELKNAGVTIGAHSHSHPHFPEMSIDEVKQEIETSNKIFLKELGEIPKIFAYPYGETNLEIIDLLKDFKYRIAFGQHSGVINETSNMYFLPRFSLNEQYSDIKRVKFAAKAKGMGVYDFVPEDPTIWENPPFIGFSLLDSKLSKNLNCFLFDSDGKIESDLFKFVERIEIRLNRKMKEGRSRMNCSSLDKDNTWRWFGHQFYVKNN